MFDSLLNTPLKLLASYFRKIGCILMFDWVLDTPLRCLKKDKNYKKPGQAFDDDMRVDHSDVKTSA